ncbi:OB-fold protein [Klebsiella pneumoniae]|uniref:OB-fold protein n=1 Tax=Klebsiella pneumoniae TaxID=573 RepID=UPI000CE327B1|nr:zinc-ribbon domain-containing protein [Klebsiella pneumoniae]MBZ1983239.1 zinc-ribbon domain-containing protein [Klebsiella pneumoniae]WLX91426.1 zinc-ribbon domain-containing protein [Klebsiella pneumoniae]
MALIKCHECAKEVSDTATSCPNCGAPISSSQQTSQLKNEQEPRKVGFLLLFGIIVFPILFVWFLFRKGYSKKARIMGIAYLVISIIFLGGSSEDDSYDDTETESVSSTSPSNGRPDVSSLAEFSAKEILDAYSANTVAADKQFKGKWLIISGKVGNINTDITDSAYIEFSVNNSFNSPQATFIESEEDKLANLRQGQFVKAVCIGNGDIVKTPMLKNCTLVE